MWRVGDGWSIKIWQDRWIDSPNTFSIQTPVLGLENDARVSDLIDDDTNWWKTNLVKEIFMEEEAAKICSLAICPTTQMDKIVWGVQKRGTIQSIVDIIQLGKIVQWSKGVRQTLPNFPIFREWLEFQGTKSCKDFPLESLQ